MALIPCPECDAVNRVPEDRPRAEARCGRCKQALFAGHPVALSTARFDRHAGSDLPMLVDFWAEWCGPCRMMAPVFEQAAAELEPDVRLGKVDTEAEPALAGRYGIRSIPTMILFHRGREIARQSGAMPLRPLLDWVARSLAAAEA